MKREKNQSILFLLEELSAEEMLRQLMRRCFPEYSCTYRRFSGKPELLARLEKTIRNHQNQDCRIIILCDQDEDDCVKLKERIRNSCKKTGRNQDCVIRICCRELESWYLAQLDIVEAHFAASGIATQQSKYRNPDNCTKPSKILERLTNGNYQKVKGSRIMGRFMDPDDTTSTSFKHFIQSILF